MELLLVQFGEDDLFVVRLHLILNDPAGRINGFIGKRRHGDTSCTLSALFRAVFIVGRTREGL